MSTLNDKITAAKDLLGRILDEHGPEHVGVAWTGGKDSTVALDIWRGLLFERSLSPARAISIDTGLKFPEIVAFRDQWADEWNVELTIARPKVDIITYPFAEDKVACCRELKVEPLHNSIRELGAAALITGLRRDEHETRQDRDFVELRTQPEYAQVNAILDFTEMDVWAYITSRGLPFCTLYAAGYRSLGCVPCTAKSGETERSGRDQDKESRLDVLRSLGYF